MSDGGTGQWDKVPRLFGELVYIPPSIVYFGTGAALQYNPLTLKIASASKMDFLDHFSGFSQSPVLVQRSVCSGIWGEVAMVPMSLSGSILRAPLRLPLCQLW